MSRGFKSLKPDEFIQYVKDNHGKLVANPFFKNSHFYECDHNTLIIENTTENRVTLYFDREKYYRERDNLSRRRNQSPVKDKQSLIENIRDTRDELVRQLFSELNMKRPETLVSTDLAKMDRAIKKYGYENAFEKLTLNLIVFAGEYIREKRGGDWLVEPNPSYPKELEPIFVDGSSKRYSFELNVQLQKQFLEKGTIKMTGILKFALLPPVFKRTNR